MHDLLNYLCKNTNFIDLKLYQYGMERCHPLHSYGPAMRQHYLLHYILEGKGELHLNTNNTIYTLKKGQAFLLCPQSVSTYTADEKDPWYYAWVEFDGLQAQEAITEAGLSEVQPIFDPIDLKTESLLRKHMIYLTDHTHTSSYNKIAHAYQILDALINESKFKKSIKKENLKRFYVDAAIDFIAKSYNKDISIEDIAEYCNIDRSYLSRLFRNQLGITTQEFLIQYRMSIACNLLEKTTAPIGTIALSVGYPNQMHFSRAFKRTYGLSPREWKKTNIKTEKGI